MKPAREEAAPPKKLTAKEAAKQIRAEEYKALEKLRAEEKKMTAAALKAKDKALADKLRHVPTSYRKALAKLSPKDKCAFVGHVMLKENRPDGPTGNVCISKYTLGDDVKEGEGVEGEVWFPVGSLGLRTAHGLRAPICSTQWPAGRRASISYLLTYLLFTYKKKKNLLTYLLCTYLLTYLLRMGRPSDCLTYLALFYSQLGPY